MRPVFEQRITASAGDIDKAAGRPIRVPTELVAPFLGVDESGADGAGSAA